MSVHVYEVRPRKDHRSVDLISDALPFDPQRTPAVSPAGAWRNEDPAGACPSLRGETKWKPREISYVAERSR